ncbi:flagellar protein [bacterium]|nr:flagellar protein [bacterium]MBU1993610.1 flagellar protein [bacterium]
MLRWILFLFFAFNLYALEITLQGAKENFQSYSTLHIKDSDSFLCQEIKNDLNQITKIVCAFSKHPSKKIKEIQNDFFQIKSQIQKKTFFLTITPYYKIKSFPIVFNLSKDDTVFQANAKLSSHWMILGYKEELPYLDNDNKSDIGINFPFFLNRDKLPYVGGLDIKGNPVHIKKVQDVTDYLRIKNYYKDAQYDLCLELINEVLLDYPNSLFKAELLFYKIKVYAKLKNYDNVIEFSKIYLKEYSSDENVPEVLSLNSKSYSMIGLSTDADYFFDRLFSEHEDSPYAKWGYIYKGEMLESGGSLSKALMFYEKALLETDDLEIAATAAYKLAQYKISTPDKKEAAEYIMKIIQAKPGFFMNDLTASMEMMYTFAEDEDYETASEIARVILNEINMDHDEYERLLRDRAVWLSNTAKKQEALGVLNEYIEKYKYGNYEDEIKVIKDSLFFDTVDANLSTKLNEYNTLIETYQNDSIGNRAIYEKAKLLLQNGMYSDVLGFKDSLASLDAEKYTDTQEIIKESAIGVMKQALKDKECQEVLNISADYNITLSSEWDESIYDCAMIGANFLLAKETASKNLKSKDLIERKKWLYRYIKVDFRTGNYSDVVEASKELIELIGNDKNSEYKDIYRILFDAYQRLEDDNNMIASLVKIQSLYGLDYKDIERYVRVMAIGSNTKDDNLIIKYATEVMKIQNSSNSYAQSPYVEFTLYQAYMNKENFNDALEILKALDKVDLNKNQRSRQKYLLGSIYDKLWRNDEAKVAYQEAIDADSASAWAKLALDAKELNK